MTVNADSKAQSISSPLLNYPSTTEHIYTRSTRDLVYEILPCMPSTPNLILYLTPPRYARLSQLLLNSPHGGPIRTLPLLLVSGTRFYELHIPCVLMYDRASHPTLTTTAMTRAEWGTLCQFVQENSVLEVVLGVEGQMDILGRLVRNGEVVEIGNVEVRFWWQEKAKAMGAEAVKDWVRRGLERMSEVVRVRKM